MALIDLVGGNNYVPVSRDLCVAIGPTEAILYCELVDQYRYWSNCGKLDDEGMFFSTIDQIQSRVGLSKGQQLRCFKKLSELGLIEVVRKGLPAKRFVMVYEDPQFLRDFYFKTLTKPEIFRKRKTRQLDGAKPDNKMAQNPTETNLYITNLNSSSSSNNNSCRIFEKEFGRPLSPIERETLQSWFNDFSEELVTYALKVAVLGDNRTFRYIQGILDHWQGEGVKCIQDVERLEQQHQAEKQRRTKPGKRISIAEHNGQVLPELFIENKTSREEIIQIFDSHGLNLQKARKALRYLATLNASTIKTIAKALSQKNKTVKNPVGLLESNPQAIAKAVLSGSLYPEGKKPREVPICETTGREYAVYAPL